MPCSTAVATNLCSANPISGNENGKAAANCAMAAATSLCERFGISTASYDMGGSKSMVAISIINKSELSAIKSLTAADNLVWKPLSAKPVNAGSVQSTVTFSIWTRMVEVDVSVAVVLVAVLVVAVVLVVVVDDVVSSQESHINLHASRISTPISGSVHFSGPGMRHHIGSYSPLQFSRVVVVRVVIVCDVVVVVPDVVVLVVPVTVVVVPVTVVVVSVVVVNVVVVPVTVVVVPVVVVVVWLVVV